MKNNMLSKVKVNIMIVNSMFYFVKVNAISINKDYLRQNNRTITPPHAVDYDNYRKPYLLIIYDNGEKSFCSSIMISHTKLLTVKHCIEPDVDGKGDTHLVQEIIAIFPIAENSVPLKIYFESAYYPTTSFDAISSKRAVFTANNLIEKIPVLLD